jgi:RNA polymerase sigma factor (sigma-70 family)
MSQAPEDLEAFIAREHPRLLGTISLVLGDAAVAEEVVQEALVAVASRWRRVRGMAAPGAYAHRTAMNLATSAVRRRGAERRARARAGFEVTTVHHDPDTADRLAVRAAVRDLPAAQREAVVLRWFLQLSVDETAARMGRSNQAVRNLTHRAVRQLRQVLDVDLEVEEAADAH